MHVLPIKSCFRGLKELEAKFLSPFFIRKSYFPYLCRNFKMKDDDRLYND